MENKAKRQSVAELLPSSSPTQWTISSDFILFLFIRYCSVSCSVFLTDSCLPFRMISRDNCDNDFNLFALLRSILIYIYFFHSIGRQHSQCLNWVLRIFSMGCSIIWFCSILYVCIPHPVFQSQICTSIASFFACSTFFRQSLNQKQEQKMSRPSFLHNCTFEIREQFLGRVLLFKKKKKTDTELLLITLSWSSFFFGIF